MKYVFMYVYASFGKIICQNVSACEFLWLWVLFLRLCLLEWNEIELNWIDDVFVQVWLCVSAWTLMPQFDTNNFIIYYQKEVQLCFFVLEYKKIERVSEERKKV